MYDQLYHNSPERFTDLLPTNNDQETVLLEQAASQTEGATATVLHQGDDPNELHLAKETYAQYANAANAWREQNGFQEMPRVDQDTCRTTAESALRNGGAIVKLTVIPGNTTSFFDNLAYLKALTQQL